VRAQSLPAVGFLGSDSPELYADRLRAFRRGLKDAGYIESENVAIEYRWANGDNNRLSFKENCRAGVTPGKAAGSSSLLCADPNSNLHQA
jgi:hypothetical protein